VWEQRGRKKIAYRENGNPAKKTEKIKTSPHAPNSIYGD
jgi:hypothetical protein